MITEARSPIWPISRFPAKYPAGRPLGRQEIRTTGNLDRERPLACALPGKISGRPEILPGAPFSSYRGLADGPRRECRGAAAGDGQCVHGTVARAPRDARRGARCCCARAVRSRRGARCCCARAVQSRRGARCAAVLRAGASARRALSLPRQRCGVTSWRGHAQWSVSVLCCCARAVAEHGVALTASRAGVSARRALPLPQCGVVPRPPGEAAVQCSVSSSCLGHN